MNKLKEFLYKPLMAPTLGIRSPDICVLGGEESLALNGTAALVGNKTELLWSHAHDYDTYLNDLHKKEAEENIAVFVEPSGPMFPWDELVSEWDHLWSVEEYSPSHCRFFDYVEKELKLEVIIAAHPKSNHDTDPLSILGRDMLFETKFFP